MTVNQPARMGNAFLTKSVRAADGRLEWYNWLGEEKGRPLEILRPTDRNELCNIVRDADTDGVPVRAFGAGHSFNALPTTDGYAIDTSELNALLEVDIPNARVRVEGGIRLGELVLLLDMLDLALPTVGGILEQSLAGAIATGTHGSGLGLGSMSSYVIGLDIVDATGQLRHLSARGNDPVAFDAARVGLGAIGIVYAVTLQLERAFNLRTTASVTTLERTLGDQRYRKEALSHRHYQFLWSPYGATVVTLPHDYAGERNAVSPVQSLQRDRSRRP